MTRLPLSKWEAAYHAYISQQATKYLPWDELPKESRKIWKIMLKGIDKTPTVN